jgi:hypothetical protein
MHRCGLVERRPLLQVARICYESVFPYFMGGILFAGIVSGAFSHSSAWQGAPVLFPVAVLGYLYSLSRTPTITPAQFQSANSPTEDKELVGVGSRGRSR